MKRNSRSITGILTCVLAVAVSASTHAQSTYVIGGVDNTLQGENFWGWDGLNYESVRQALECPTNFGPGGIVETRITTKTLSTVNSQTLKQLDAFVSSFWLDTLTSDAHTDCIIDFFLGGGDLILIQDDEFHDKIGDRLGIPALSSIGSASNGIAPLYNGPFGTASNVTQGGITGRLHIVDILTQHGQPAGLNSSLEITAAYWQPGEYGPGAGSLLIIADANMVATEATYAPLNNNGIYTLNAFGLLASREKIHVIGGPSASLLPGSWAWDGGSQIQGFRDALESTQNFGKDGTVPYRIVTEDVSEITFTGLYQMDTFVVPWWSDSTLSDDDTLDIISFFFANGNLLLLNDDTAHDKIAEWLLCPTYANSDGSNSNGVAPLFDGPFGTALNVAQAGTTGQLDPALVDQTGGHAGAINGSGEITGAYWGREEYSYGTGAMVILGDVCMISANTADYTLMNDNATFALNAMSYLIEERPFMIGGPDIDLAPTSGSWNWDGLNLETLRDALETQTNFGPSGTSGRRVETMVLEDVDAVTLADYDAFVSTWWWDTDTTADQVDAVVEFFHNGGHLVLLQDSSSQDSIGAALGIPTFASSDGSPSNGNAPLFAGPFGTATNVTQGGTVGQLDIADILAKNGTVAGRNTSNEATIAYWKPGQYAPGTGSLIIIADVCTVSSLGATYNPLNQNGIFTLNCFAAMTDFECSGDFDYYGSGCAGSGGFIPAIRYFGCPMLGNPYEVEISCGLGGAFGFWIIGFNGAMSVPYKGCDLLVQPPWFTIATILNGQNGVAGDGTATFPSTLPEDPGFTGLIVNFQGLFSDTGASQNVSATEGLEFVVGD